MGRKRFPHQNNIEGDIQSLDWIALLVDVEVFYHQAAQAGVRASWAQGFGAYTERNINATQVLLEVAKDALSLKRLVFASTPEAIGEIFKIGGGSRVVLTEVIHTMEKVVGRSIRTNHIETAMGDARHTPADVSKVQKILGLLATVLW